MNRERQVRCCFCMCCFSGILTNLYYTCYSLEVRRASVRLCSDDVESCLVGSFTAHLPFVLCRFRGPVQPDTSHPTTSPFSASLLHTFMPLTASFLGLDYCFQVKKQKWSQPPSIVGFITVLFYGFKVQTLSFCCCPNPILKVSKYFPVSIRGLGSPEHRSHQGSIWDSLRRPLGDWPGLLWADPVAFQPFGQHLLGWALAWELSGE